MSLKPKTKQPDEFGAMPKEHPCADTEEYVRRCAEETLIAEALLMPSEAKYPEEYPDAAVKEQKKKKKFTRMLLSKSAGLLAAVVATATVLTTSGVISLPLFPSSQSSTRASYANLRDYLPASFYDFCNHEEGVALFCTVYELMKTDDFDNLFVTLWDESEYLDRLFDAAGEEVNARFDFDGAVFAAEGMLEDPVLGVYITYYPNGNRGLDFLSIEKEYPAYSQRFSFDYCDNYINYALSGDFLSSSDVDNAYIREYVSHYDETNDVRNLLLASEAHATIRNGYCCGEAILLEKEHDSLLNGDGEDDGGTVYEFRLLLDEFGAFDWDKLRAAQFDAPNAMERFIRGDLDVLLDKNGDYEWNSEQVNVRNHWSSTNCEYGLVLVRGITVEDGKPCAIAFDWSWSPEGNNEPIHVKSLHFGE